jgi:hypothetical protein
VAIIRGCLAASECAINDWMARLSQQSFAKNPESIDQPGAWAGHADDNLWQVPLICRSPLSWILVIMYFLMLDSVRA